MLLANKGIHKNQQCFIVVDSASFIRPHSLRQSGLHCFVTCNYLRCFQFLKNITFRPYMYGHWRLQNIFRDGENTVFHPERTCMPNHMDKNITFKPQSFWVSGPYPPNGILETRKREGESHLLCWVPRKELTSITGSGGKSPTLLGPSQGANLNHWIWWGSHLLCWVPRKELTSITGSGGEVTYSIGSLAKS
jgi:hypothetical protein